MDRLNSINIGYLKEIPMETIPEILYDAVLNELNDNLDDTQEVIQGLSDILRINFLIYNFVNEIANGGVEMYINGEFSVMHSELIKALQTIDASETANRSLFILKLREEKMDYIDIEAGTDEFYDSQDLLESIVNLHEPIMDFLIRFNMEYLRDLDDEDYL